MPRVPVSSKFGTTCVLNQKDISQRGGKPKKDGRSRYELSTAIPDVVYNKLRPEWEASQRVPRDLRRTQHKQEITFTQKVQNTYKGRFHLFKELSTGLHDSSVESIPSSRCPTREKTPLWLLRLEDSSQPARLVLSLYRGHLPLSMHVGNAPILARVSFFLDGRWFVFVSPPLEVKSKGKPGPPPTPMVQGVCGSPPYRQPALLSGFDVDPGFVVNRCNHNVAPRSPRAPPPSPGLDVAMIPARKTRKTPALRVDRRRKPVGTPYATGPHASEVRVGRVALDSPVVVPVPVMGAQPFHLANFKSEPEPCPGPVFTPSSGRFEDHAALTPILAARLAGQRALPSPELDGATAPSSLSCVGTPVHVKSEPGVVTSSAHVKSEPVFPIGKLEPVAGGKAAPAGSSVKHEPVPCCDPGVTLPINIVPSGFPAFEEELLIGLTPTVFDQPGEETHPHEDYNEEWFHRSFGESSEAASFLHDFLSMNIGQRPA